MEFKQQVAELKERVRQSRIERGLPEERPARFVEPVFSFVLVERCKPVFEFVAKYAKLCADANDILQVDTSKLDKYRESLELIAETKDTNAFIPMYGVAMLSAIKYIRETDEHDIDEYLRRLYQYLMFAETARKQPLNNAVYNYSLTSAENYDCYKEARAEYERLLNDDAYFQAEFARYRAHYDKIKELI